MSRITVTIAEDGYEPVAFVLEDIAGAWFGLSPLSGEVRGRELNMPLDDLVSATEAMRRSRPAPEPEPCPICHRRHDDRTDCTELELAWRRGQRV